jgi:C_GCAxxG_C_C family probable redox protein
MIENKEQLIEKAYKTGFDSEKAWGGCGQCTMIGVFEALGIDNPQLIKAGSGLAAGGGRMCDGACGGYAGGIMAMSSIFGRRREFMDGDIDNKNASYEMACGLREVFLDQYGTVTCKDIHKKLFGRTYDMYNPDEKEQFDKDGAHTTKCTGVVGTAARESVRLILKEAEKQGLSLEQLREKAKS